MNVQCLFAFIVTILPLLSKSDDSADFEHDFHYQHEKSGEVFRMKGKGKLNDVIFLEEDASLKKISCTANLVFLATKNATFISRLKPGVLVSGSPHWPCLSEVDGELVQGIYRRVKKVKIKAKSVELVTERAGLYDVFKTADLHVHYTPGNWSGISKNERNEDIKRRQKRDADDRSVFERIWPVLLDYENNNLFTIPINYDDSNDKAKKELKVPQSDTWWSVKCTDCYAYFRTGITFELKIDDNGLEKFLLQLSGTLKINTDVEAEIKKEWSTDKSWDFPKNPTGFKAPNIPILRFGNPLIPDMDLKITFKPLVTLLVDLKAEVTANLKFGFEKEDVVTVTMKKERQRSFLMETSFTFGDIQQHQTSYNLEGKVTLGTAVIPKMMVEPKIEWGYKVRFFGVGEGYPLFQVTFTSPLNISFIPKVEAEVTWNVPDKTVCLVLYHQGNLELKVSPVIFGIDTFGKTRWNSTITDALTKTFKLWDRKAFDFCDNDKCCIVACFGSSEKGATRGIDAAVGAMEKKISRIDAEFLSLSQIQSKDIVFLSEEKSDSWCGTTSRSCVDCTNAVVGHAIEQKCADRMASASMATAIGALTKLTRKQWPKRKLRILEIWDEPTASHPQGRHGDSSPHYEGRAAQLTVTGELSPSQLSNPSANAPAADTSSEIMKKLGQLAVCSGFPFVDRTSNYVHVAVKKEKPSAISHETRFQNQMSKSNIYKVDINQCEKWKSKFPTFKADDTPEYICGEINNRITRFDQIDFERLYYYQYNDVEFQNEERNFAWCGISTRSCIDCHVSAGTDSAWNRCADRVMSERLAFRLRRLASLVPQKWSDRKLKVLDAWSEATSQSSNSYGNYESTSLYYEGRAASLTVTGTNPAGLMSELEYLAKCAGFDFVQHKSSGFIEVFVKQQKQGTSVIVNFLETQLLAVEPDPHTQQYMYPEEAREETIKTLLFDGSGQNAKKKLSDNWSVSEFKHPKHRYFRLDESIVECLQALRTKVGKPLKIPAGSGYRPRSRNLDNIEERHAEETFRFQTGQAVELQMGSGKTSPEVAVSLAEQILRTCTSIHRRTRRGIGLGVHSDRLYYDVRPFPSINTTNHIKVWSVGEGDAIAKAFSKLTTLANHVQNGGPEIDPSNKTSACSMPHLGEGKHFFTVPFNEKRDTCSSETSSQFCKDTLPHRTEVLKTLADLMKKKTGLNPVTHSAEYAALSTTFKDACGRCMGSGPIWKKKVESFVKLLYFFKTSAPSDFKKLKDTVSFFNLGRENSEVRNLACKTHLCIEKTALYGIFAPSVDKLYRPDPSKSIDELLYSPSDNPLPVIDLIEQFIAYHASGVVRVYVDNVGDMAALNEVLKNLMVYNHNVTRVDFHITSSVKPIRISETLQRKSAVWAGGSCAAWSRAAVTPYNVEVISHDRVRRSLEENKDSDFIRGHFKNWEHEWLLKT